jgi:hypothetical protein
MTQQSKTHRQPTPPRKKGSTTGVKHVGYEDESGGSYGIKQDSNRPIMLMVPWSETEEEALDVAQMFVTKNNITKLLVFDVADVLQELKTANTLLAKIEYHLSIGSGDDLTNTEL